MIASLKQIRPNLQHDTFIIYNNHLQIWKRFHSNNTYLSKYECCTACVLTNLFNLHIWPVTQLCPISVNCTLCCSIVLYAQVCNCNYVIVHCFIVLFCTVSLNGKVYYIFELSIVRCQYVFCIVMLHCTMWYIYSSSWYIVMHCTISVNSNSVLW